MRRLNTPNEWIDALYVQMERVEGYGVVQHTFGTVGGEIVDFISFGSVLHYFSHGLVQFSSFDVLKVSQVSTSIDKTSISSKKEMNIILLALHQENLYLVCKLSDIGTEGVLDQIEWKEESTSVVSESSFIEIDSQHAFPPLDTLNASSEYLLVQLDVKLESEEKIDVVHCTELNFVPSMLKSEGNDLLIGSEGFVYKYSHGGVDVVFSFKDYESAVLSVIRDDITAFGLADGHFLVQSSPSASFKVDLMEGPVSMIERVSVDVFAVLSGEKGCFLLFCGKKIFLEHSNAFDAVLCIASYTVHSIEYIWIGTYSSHVLVYQSRDGPSNYSLEQIFRLPFPVQSIRFCPLTSDTFKCILTTSKGIHIFLPEKLISHSETVEIV